MGEMRQHRQLFAERIVCALYLRSVTDDSLTNVGVVCVGGAA